MGLGDFVKDAIKASRSIGKVSGSEFPVGTYINLTNTEGDASMTFTLPNKSEYIVTHDKVKKAEVLAMGVIDVEEKKNVVTTYYGTKYRVELTDGKVAILTVGIGDTLYQIEHIIF